MPEVLNPDALIERAQQEAGLRDFDSESFRDGLSVLLADARRSTRMCAEGPDLFASDMVRNLASRLRVADYVRRHPEVLNEKIERPVVVLGAPRTGTTLVSNLLATDPARRSLLDWVVEDPVPPPTLETLTTDPRCLAKLARDQAVLDAYPEAGRYYRISATYPTECIWPMNHDFKTLAWELFLPAPTYLEFLLGCDMTPTYAYHRLFLQMLQSRAPGSWNLKMPSHALHIRWMHQAYPDARIVWTHRDPMTAIGSLMSLMTASEGRLTGGNPDLAYIARAYPPQVAAHVDRMLAFREAHPEVPVYDLHYARVMRDPIGEMRELYAFLGDPFSPEVEAGMRAWLDDNPQGKYGRHEYDLERFGHTEASLRPYFENYLGKAEVEREGL